jgi:acyl-CoA dehydrogenase
MAAAAMGAYSMVRQQFGIPIGKMDGISEKVGKVAALSYMFEGARVFGCSALDAGIQPPVASAIMKAWSTEVARECGIDAMDVLAGAAVMQGPNNIMGRGYCSAPVAITVEGANIMTRTLMVFGQGATRCHPYAYKVVQAVEANDVPAFRHNLLGWMWQFISVFVMTLLRSVTRGHFTVAVPDVAPETRHWYRRLGWAASRFGLMTNLAMFLISGKLKARGNLTGRYADAVAWMLLTISALRRYEAEGRRPEDLPLLDYSCQHAMEQVQLAFEGIYENFGGGLGFVLRTVGRWWLMVNPLGHQPNDAQSAAAAQTMQAFNNQYLRLNEGCYLPSDGTAGFGRLLEAFRLTTEAEPVRTLIRHAQREKTLPRGNVDELAELAAEKGVIGSTEKSLLIRAREACLAAIEVDVFTPAEFYGDNGPSSLTASGDGGQPR